MNLLFQGIEFISYLQNKNVVEKSLKNHEKKKYNPLFYFPKSKGRYPFY